MSQLVECEWIELTVEGSGYVARFEMNTRKQAILKEEPYSWRFEEFSKPNRRLERLLTENDLLPSIVLSESRCIRPVAYFDFMES